jgi:hypothetical protein
MNILYTYMHEHASELKLDRNTGLKKIHTSANIPSGILGLKFLYPHSYDDLYQDVLDNMPPTVEYIQIPVFADLRMNYIPFSIVSVKYSTWYWKLGCKVTEYFPPNILSYIQPGVSYICVCKNPTTTYHIFNPQLLFALSNVIKHFA